MNRDEVIKRIENSDIVVDQFYEGILGLIGIEAMAYAKPVIGYVSQKIMLRHFGEKMPIANTRTPKDILNVINNLIIEKNRIKLGKESKEFVKKYYSVESVVPRILALKNNEGKLLL